MCAITPTKKGHRVWLQGLYRFGWNGGDTYTTEFTEEAIILVRATEGKVRKVTNSKGGIIDLVSMKVTKWARDAEHCDVTYTATTITIVRK